jgi:hypothetical protein
MARRGGLTGGRPQAHDADGEAGCGRWGAHPYYSQLEDFNREGPVLALSRALGGLESEGSGLYDGLGAGLIWFVAVALRGCSAFCHVPAGHLVSISKDLEFRGNTAADEQR